MKIYEQADRSAATTSPTGCIYSWILDGIKGHSAKGKQLVREGWKFVGRNCFTTQDPDLAVRTAEQTGCDVVTNGSHARLRACGILCILDYDLDERAERSDYESRIISAHRWNEADCGGAFDGFTVTSDADCGL